MSGVNVLSRLRSRLLPANNLLRRVAAYCRRATNVANLNPGAYARCDPTHSKRDPGRAVARPRAVSVAKQKTRFATADLP